MVLDMASLSAVRLPTCVDVPRCALNHTGVRSSDHNELILRSRSTKPLAAQMEALLEQVDHIQFELCEPGPMDYLATCCKMG